MSPTLKIIDSIKIDVYSREHPPPHFHVIYAEYEELIEIKTLVTYVGSLPKAQRNKVIEWAKIRIFNAEFSTSKPEIMRKKLVIPRIIKIQKIEGLNIYCMFNNGENRLLKFDNIFKEWSITKNDVEYPLLTPSEFKKVKLRNFALSWSNISVILLSEDGQEETHPYELSPDELFRLSVPAELSNSEKFGNLIKSARQKAGLTQEQLALRSGT
ncbi:MAG: DUF4160 domain-containing protein, partial [Cytophagales bacterium]|nr:DUF4160 domain-containing protein [Cytophagales bacterium]